MRLLHPLAAPLPLLFVAAAHQNAVVVKSPKSGVNFFNLGDYEEQFEAARQRALPVLRQLLEEDRRISLKQRLLPANKKLLREVRMLCIAVHAVTTGVCSSVDIQRAHGQLCGHPVLQTSCL